MQQQVHEAEAQLAHLRVGGAESARPLHLLKQLFGNRLRRFPNGARTDPATPRSQHQFSMICEGSSTKSQATLVPASERISTRLSRWCSRWPNSWKMVSTSRCVSSAGLPPTGGVRLPQIRPRCGLEAVPAAGRR